MQRTNLFDFIKIVLRFAAAHESVPQLPLKTTTALRHTLESIRSAECKIHGDVSQHLLHFQMLKRLLN